MTKRQAVFPTMAVTAVPKDTNLELGALGVWIFIGQRGLRGVPGSSYGPFWPSRAPVAHKAQLEGAFNETGFEFLWGAQLRATSQPQISGPRFARFLVSDIIGNHSPV
jgi:hypothetical protein